MLKMSNSAKQRQDYFTTITRFFMAFLLYVCWKSSPGCIYTKTENRTGIVVVAWSQTHSTACKQFIILCTSISNSIRIWHFFTVSQTENVLAIWNKWRKQVKQLYVKNIRCSVIVRASMTDSLQHSDLFCHSIVIIQAP